MLGDNTPDPVWVVRGKRVGDPRYSQYEGYANRWDCQCRYLINEDDTVRGKM